MFIGQGSCAIDEKSRLTIPVKFRAGLGDLFYITGGLETCLTVYTPTSWEKTYNKIQMLDNLKTDARAYQRYVLSNATEADLDKQGRVLIPMNLRQHAKLEKDCLVIGSGDHLEIWNVAVWNEYIDSFKSGMSQIAEQLSGM